MKGRAKTAVAIAAHAKAEPTKPVLLQVNRRGAWMTVIRFDAADDEEASHVQDAADALGHADNASRFRIAIDEPLGHALKYWEWPEGWRLA